jgi:hypothetical protein
MSQKGNVGNEPFICKGTSINTECSGTESRQRPTNCDIQIHEIKLQSVELKKKLMGKLS